MHPTKGSKNFIAIKLSFKKASFEKSKILLKDMISRRNLIISFILEVFLIFTPKTLFKKCLKFWLLLKAEKVNSRSRFWRKKREKWKRITKVVVKSHAFLLDCRVPFILRKKWSIVIYIFSHYRTELPVE